MPDAPARCGASCDRKRRSAPQQPQKMRRPPERNRKRQTLQASAPTGNEKQADVWRYVGANILLFSQTICPFASICTRTRTPPAFMDTNGLPAHCRPPPARGIARHFPDCTKATRGSAKKSPRIRKNTGSFRENKACFPENFPCFARPLPQGLEHSGDEAHVHGLDQTQHVGFHRLTGFAQVRILQK